MAFPNPPRTWVAAETVTAALMNVHVRDALLALSTWTAYTPTWTGTTDPAIGNGTIEGGHITLGKRIDFWVKITMGSTTTYGTGAYVISLPVAAARLGFTFDGVVRDASALATYPATGDTPTSTSTMATRVLSTTAGNAFISLTGTTPVTLAVSDYLFFSGTYEAV